MWRKQRKPFVLWRPWAVFVVHTLLLNGDSMEEV